VEAVDIGEGKCDQHFRHDQAETHAKSPAAADSTRGGIRVTTGQHVRKEITASPQEFFRTIA
jgi:hypothetical protein